jgi:hypothetical protein
MSTDSRRYWFTNFLEKFYLLGRDATVIAFVKSPGTVSFLQMAVVMGLQIRKVREI